MRNVKKKKPTYEQIVDRAYIIALTALALAFLSFMLSLGWVAKQARSQPL